MDCLIVTGQIHRHFACGNSADQGEMELAALKALNAFECHIFPSKSMTMGLWIESPHLTQGGGASQSLEAGARYFGGSDATFALLAAGFCSQSMSKAFS